MGLKKVLTFIVIMLMLIITLVLGLDYTFSTKEEAIQAKEDYLIETRNFYKNITTDFYNIEKNNCELDDNNNDKKCTGCFDYKIENHLTNFTYIDHKCLIIKSDITKAEGIIKINKFLKQEVLRLYPKKKFIYKVE